MNRSIKQEKVAVLRESYFEITGNVTEAMILNQMIYWSRRVADYDKFIKEENSRRAQDGKDEIELTYGWIHKTASELKDEIMSDDSRVTIQRKIDNLVNKGYLERRNNPNHAYDRTYQYRVNLLKIYDDLNALGYQLEGFKIENEQSNVQNEQCKNQSQQSNVQNEHLNVHSERAIPETTAENTTEITSSPSYPPEKPKFANPISGEDDDTKGEVSELLGNIGIDNIRHKDMVKTISGIIGDLMRTGKAGQTKYNRAQIKDTLGRLCAGDIDTVIDRYTAKAASGEIRNADSFLKACLVSAGKSAQLLKLSKKSDTGAIDRGNPSFDVDEYVRLSMERLHRE